MDSSSSPIKPLARNKTFHPEREPLRRATTLQLDSEKVQGPVKFLNPTQARFTQIQPSVPEDEELSLPPPSPRAETPTATLQTRPTGFRAPQPALTYQWTSRNSRKGRHTLLITDDHLKDPDITAPEPTTGASQIFRNIGRMFTSFPEGDVSFDVALLFTVGSAIFVLNGFFCFLPLAYPESAFDGEVLWGGGITAFAGIVIFEIGGYLSFLEAINEDHADSFGWAVEQLAEHPFDNQVEHDRVRPISRQDNMTSTIGKRSARRKTSIVTLTSSPAHAGPQTWQWLPSSRLLRTHYMHSIGFLACLILLASITIFCIAAICSLPPLYARLDTKAKLVGAYWAPQLVGGVGFVVAGVLFTVETQETWWKSAPGVLGWWIGVWSFVGGVVRSTP